MKKLIGVLVILLALGGTAVGAGTVIKNNNEAVKKAIEQTTPVATDDIGRDKAKEIALNEAGVAESEVTWIEVERDYDDGRLENNVEFRVGNKEYEYEVDAKSGKVFERDIDVEDEYDDIYDDNWDDRWDD